MEGFDIPEKLPLLISSNQVLLPGATWKILVTAPANQDLIKDVMSSGVKLIGVVPVKDKSDDIKNGDVGTVGFLLTISSSNYPENGVAVMVLGLCRFTIDGVDSSSPYTVAQVKVHEEFYGEQTIEHVNKVLGQVKDIILPIIDTIGLLPGQYMDNFKNLMDKFSASYIIDLCIHVINCSFEEKWQILKALDLKDRIAIGLPLIIKFFGEKGNKMSKKASSSSNIRHKSRKKGTLRMEEDCELEDLLLRLEKANIPDKLHKVITKDYEKLKRISPYSADNEIIWNYLEFVADLPWSIFSEETLEIKIAKEHLDNDHYGMEKLKKRIVEFLAVKKLNAGMKGPILCFIGPPGVGKTSIGRSIANILNRKFQRISLGGVTHESVIRGHRKTYIGAMPGRILEVIKSAGTKNPVILLDEIDKLGREGRNGDPNAALLEVLDPEQNKYFTDHYLSVPFDLSNVIFIATANTSTTIPAPLLDRLEVIKVDGYTMVEKYHIASKYLLPKQLNLHGLGSDKLQLTDEAIYKIISEYTREAGVRSLERNLAAVCRSVAVKVAESSSSDCFPFIIEADHIQEIIGIAPYHGEEILSVPCHPGVSIGLAWTNLGGSLLVVEATRVPKSTRQTTKLILTGCLGSVMKESAQIAYNWVRSAISKCGIIKGAEDLLEKSDIHIHFPEGATNKEGPSAGVTIATALMSLFSGIPVNSGLAMTGELTLQGLVLPVGGIKEKLMTAHRLGIKKVIIPYKSRKNLADLPQSILDQLEVIAVKTMIQVLEIAFDGQIPSVKNLSKLSSKL